MTRGTRRTRLKRRDNYRGQIDDFGDRGALAASRDLYSVLVILTSYANAATKEANKSALREEWVEIGRKRDGSAEMMTVGQLLRIASDAYNQSINEVVFVYRQLLENEEAAAALVEAMPTELTESVAQYADYHFALLRTLDQRPIAKRGLVNEAKREIARMEREDGGIRGGQVR